MKRQTNILFVVLVSLALNLWRIDLTVAAKEDVEERFASLKAETGGEDEVALMTNEIDSDLNFRPEDIPVVCRLIVAQNGGLGQRLALKRNFNPWGGKRNFSPWGGKRSTADDLYRQQQLMIDLVKKGFNAWGGKRQFNSEGNDNRIVTKSDTTGKNRLPFNPWGG